MKSESFILFYIFISFLFCCCCFFCWFCNYFCITNEQFFFAHIFFGSQLVLCFMVFLSAFFQLALSAVCFRFWRWKSARYFCRGDWQQKEGEEDHFHGFVSMGFAFNLARGIYHLKMWISQKPKRMKNERKKKFRSKQAISSHLFCNFIFFAPVCLQKKRSSFFLF